MGSLVLTADNLTEIGNKLDSMDKFHLIGVSKSHRDVRDMLSSSDKDPKPYLLYNESGSSDLVLYNSNSKRYSTTLEEWATTGHLVGSKSGWIIGNNTKEDIANPFLFYPLKPTTQVVLPPLYSKRHVLKLGTMTCDPFQQQCQVCLVSLNEKEESELHILSRSSHEWLTYPFPIHLQNNNNNNINRISSGVEALSFGTLSFNLKTHAWTSIASPTHGRHDNYAKDFITTNVILPQRSHLSTIGITTPKYDITNGNYTNVGNSEPVVKRFHGVWFEPVFIPRPDLLVW